MATARETRRVHTVAVDDLDDGTVGLTAIERAGGATLAQDPAEALYAGMPRSAIELVVPDRVGTAAQLGRAIASLADGPPPLVAVRGSREEILVEVGRGSSDVPQPGAVTGLTCPACNRAVWLDDSEGVLRLACRTGHACGPETFAAVQAERVEAALLTALRTLEERAALVPPDGRAPPRGRQRAHRRALLAPRRERRATLLYPARGDRAARPGGRRGGRRVVAEERNPEFEALLEFLRDERASTSPATSVRA